jgi:hypothetical protein
LTRHHVRPQIWAASALAILAGLVLVRLAAAVMPWLFASGPPAG